MNQRALSLWEYLISAHFPSKRASILIKYSSTDNCNIISHWGPKHSTWHLILHISLLNQRSVSTFQSNCLIPHCFYTFYCTLFIAHKNSVSISFHFYSFTSISPSMSNAYCTRVCDNHATRDTLIQFTSCTIVKKQPRLQRAQKISGKCCPRCHTLGWLLKAKQYGNMLKVRPVLLLNICFRVWTRTVLFSLEMTLFLLSRTMYLLLSDMLATKWWIQEIKLFALISKQDYRGVNKCYMPIWIDRTKNHDLLFVLITEASESMAFKNIIFHQRHLTENCHER